MKNCSATYFSLFKPFALNVRTNLAFRIFLSKEVNIIHYIAHNIILAGSYLKLVWKWDLLRFMQVDFTTGC